MWHYNKGMEKAYGIVRLVFLNEILQKMANELHGKVLDMIGGSIEGFCRGNGTHLLDLHSIHISSNTVTSSR